MKSCSTMNAVFFECMMKRLMTCDDTDLVRDTVLSFRLSQMPH